MKHLHIMDVDFAKVSGTTMFFQGNLAEEVSVATVKHVGAYHFVEYEIPGIIAHMGFHQFANIIIVHCAEGERFEDLKESLDGV